MGWGCRRDSPRVSHGLRTYDTMTRASLPGHMVNTPSSSLQANFASMAIVHPFLFLSGVPGVYGTDLYCTYVLQCLGLTSSVCIQIQ
jgi:hypothetical protein